MIVRYEDPTKSDELFLVVAIEIGPTGHYLRTIDEPPWESSLRRSEQFDVVSSHVPEAWRVAIARNDGYTTLILGPEAWLRPGFWDDFYRDPPFNASANRQYEEAVLRIAES